MNTITLAQIEPTTLCNLKCGFCCGRSMKQGKMTTESFEYALDQLPGITDLELQGEGESLTHPDFFKMVKIARDRGIDVSFVSNGSFFTRENVDKILNLGIVRIDCSIDSADPSIFENIRGFNLDKLFNGLTLLMSEKKRRKSAYPVVGLFGVVMKQNIHSSADLLKLYRKLKLDGGLNFQPLQSMENYTATYSEHMKEQIVSYDDFNRFTRKMSFNPLYHLIQLSSKKNGFHVKLFEKVRKFYNNSFSACHWLSRGVFINFEGYILPCSQIKEAKRYAIGKIGSTPEAEIIAKKNELSEMLSKGKMPECCAGCNTALSLVEAGS